MKEIYLINKDSLDEINKFSKSISDRFREAEEECVKQVLRQLLCREPTIEDAKKLIVGKYQGRDFYDLAYEGMMLGRITKSFENNNYTVKFESVQFKTHI